jgi:hypothetical protein
MGALTYVGNGPNFMVKAIAGQAGCRPPSFEAGCGPVRPDEGSGAGGNRTHFQEFMRRKGDGPNPLPDKTSGDDTPPLSASLAHPAPADPVLARLCSAWPALPEHIKAAILALAATGR